jgi:Arc/MetJ-type ribon-helix-helix transcriptional regulator
MEVRNKGGRPRGEPSTVVNVRIPVALLARLDRYLDWAEVHTGLKGNRNDAIRRGLVQWLEKREEALQIPPVPTAIPVSIAIPAKPRATRKRAARAADSELRDGVSEADRQAFRAAYEVTGKGRDFVRIHRLRDSLKWDREHFDRVLAGLAGSYTVELHGGDPSRLNRKQREDSYEDAHGTRYITLTWKG